MGGGGEFHSPESAKFLTFHSKSEVVAYLSGTNFGNWDDLLGCLSKKSNIIVGGFSKKES